MFKSAQATADAAYNQGVEDCIFIYKAANADPTRPRVPTREEFIKSVSARVPGFKDAFLAKLQEARNQHKELRAGNNTADFSPWEKAFTDTVHASPNLPDEHRAILMERLRERLNMEKAVQSISSSPLNEALEAAKAEVAAARAELKNAPPPTAGPETAVPVQPAEPVGARASAPPKSPGKGKAPAAATKQPATESKFTRGALIGLPLAAAGSALAYNMWKDRKSQDKSTDDWDRYVNG